MDPGVIVAIVVVLLVVIAVGLWFYTQRRRSEQLRERFGPEYEHAVDQYGDRHAAERALHEREAEVQKLDVRALAPEEAQRFGEAWRTAQARFVDDPVAAIKEADRLVQEVMAARGYPVGDFDARASLVSVDHPHVVSNYRTAHDIAQRNARGEANTEDLRQAMVHYRALFEELLHTDAVPQARDAEQAAQAEDMRAAQAEDMRPRREAPAQRRERDERKAA